MINSSETCSPSLSRAQLAKMSFLHRSSTRLSWIIDQWTMNSKEERQREREGFRFAGLNSSTTVKTIVEIEPCPGGEEWNIYTRIPSAPPTPSRFFFFLSLFPDSFSSSSSNLFLLLFAIRMEEGTKEWPQEGTVCVVVEKERKKKALLLFIKVVPAGKSRYYRSSSSSPTKLFFSFFFFFF